MKFSTAMTWLVIGTAAPLVPTLAAETGAKAAAATTGKGFHESRTFEKKATITAIDPAKRVVTLKGEGGNTFELEASPDVKNFDTLKVGDMVAAKYTQSLAVHIAPAGQATPGMKQTTTAAPPAGGQAHVGREITATLKVEAVDAKNNTVTLSDDAGNSAPVDVVDPKAQERLKTLKPGEMVVITYTEALALSLNKVAK
jgi:hypothetical protein